MKQPTREIISSGNTVWKRVDHTETGGFTLDTTNLPIGSYIRAGAMMTFDASTRMATVIPSAVLAESAANNATVYRVAKGSIFTVGKNMALLSVVPLILLQLSTPQVLPAMTV